VRIVPWRHGTCVTTMPWHLPWRHGTCVTKVPWHLPWHLPWRHGAMALVLQQCHGKCHGIDVRKRL